MVTFKYSGSTPNSKLFFAHPVDFRYGALDDASAVDPSGCSALVLAHDRAYFYDPEYRDLRAINCTPSTIQPGDTDQETLLQFCTTSATPRRSAIFSGLSTGLTCVMLRLVREFALGIETTPEAFVSASLRAEISPKTVVDALNDEKLKHLTNANVPQALREFLTSFAAKHPNIEEIYAPAHMTAMIIMRALHDAFQEYEQALDTVEDTDPRDKLRERLGFSLMQAKIWRSTLFVQFATSETSVRAFAVDFEASPFRLKFTQLAEMPAALLAEDEAQETGGPDYEKNVEQMLNLDRQVLRQPYTGMPRSAEFLLGRWVTGDPRMRPCRLSFSAPLTKTIRGGYTTVNTCATYPHWSLADAHFASREEQGAVNLTVIPRSFDEMSLPHELEITASYASLKEPEKAETLAYTLEISDYLVAGHCAQPVMMNRSSEIVTRIMNGFRRVAIDLCATYGKNLPDAVEFFCTAVEDTDSDNKREDAETAACAYRSSSFAGFFDIPRTMIDVLRYAGVPVSLMSPEQCFNGHALPPEARAPVSGQAQEAPEFDAGSALLELE